MLQLHCTTIGRGFPGSLTTNMATVVALVKKHAPPEAIHRSKLKKNGCLLRKDNLPTPNVIIDLDKIPIADDSKRADFLFASNDSRGWIVPIEMKNGTPDVQKSALQLQASTKIAEAWTSSVDVQNFRAVLVSSNFPKAERDLLKKQSNKVRFGNKIHAIERLACGTSLMQIFS